MHSFVVALGLAFAIVSVQADLPSCASVATNPQVIKGTMDFITNAKECQTDADCSGVTGVPMVCPAKMKVCMPTVMAERMAKPTKCT